MWVVNFALIQNFNDEFSSLNMNQNQMSNVSYFRDLHHVLQQTCNSSSAMWKPCLEQLLYFDQDHV